MSARDADNQLIPALLAQPQGFDLFQAISLLERAGIADGHAAVGTEQGTEAVRLSSHISLDFDASDVCDAQRGSATGEPFTLKTPVLSLLGQAGPMPAA
ncbi:MAG: type secretion system baseplate subunit TssG, partial [Pseudomonadota bacterium]